MTDSTAARRPRMGDRFIHARFLKDTARPPYSADSYAEHVVTATRRHGEQVTVYHTPAYRYDAGDRRGTWYFDLAKQNESVREWL